MLDSFKVNFNGEEVEVKKIPMRRFAALAGTLGSLPTIVKDIFADGAEVDTSNLLEKAPMILMELGDTAPEFLAVASDVELEKILDGGIDDFLALLQGVLAVNNFDVIMGYLKNLMPTQKK